jgi:DNA polymerase (family 10)
MVNAEIADIFERMSRLLAFKGRDRFRILAYQRAAASLRELREDLCNIAAEGRLEEIPGIGKDLSAMIQEYIRSGCIRRYESERRGIPDTLIDLMEIPGLGPKTLALLHKKRHIESIEDLNRLINSGELKGLRGFGEKKAENLRRGIALWMAGKKRIPLGIALPIAESILEQVRKLETVDRADVAGSVRRGRETIGDLDLLLTSHDNPEALRQFTRLPLVKQIIEAGPTRATVITGDELQVDARAVEAACYGAALVYFTGSKEHNVHLRTLARERGLKLSEYGVFRGKRRLCGRQEKEVYAALKMTFIPPELREDRGEIEAALRRALPRLLEFRELRGDLHAHSNYSDGRATMEEMVTRAGELGYEYIALADHSPSARVAHGLDLERLEQKIEELHALRRKWHGRKPLILLGAEVDILSDGKLDYPDRVLAKFDVVTASVHSGFKQSKDKMTGRLLDAIANPYVHILGHPTTRLLGSRDPVEFDLTRIIKAAAEAGVALEVNGSPYRLDLTDTMARAAQEGGALLVIGSDAHSTSQLDYVRYGVFQARRGWIESRTVVNTWSTTKLLKWLHHRRVRSCGGEQRAAKRKSRYIESPPN